jgi:hypothetical protein
MLNRNRREDALEAIRTGAFVYTDPEWNLIWGALRSTSRNLDETACRREIEQFANTFIEEGIRRNWEAAGRRKAKELEKLIPQLQATLDALTGAHAYLAWRPDGSEAAQEVVSDRVAWLTGVVGTAQWHLETQELFRNKYPPVPRTSRAIDAYWCSALRFWEEVAGCPIDESKRTIEFLVFTALPFAGATIATRDSARRFLRDPRYVSKVYHG